MARPDCDVCKYLATTSPSCGFLSFRAGLARIKVDALKAACEHRMGSSSVFGLQVRDQFIDLLWESCLAMQAKTKRVNIATVQLSEPNLKKKKPGHVPVNVTLTMDDVQVIPSLLENETTASPTEVANLEKEVKQLRADNRTFAEIQQQLMEKQQQLASNYAQLEEVVKRLQSQQNVCDRLVCTVYDRQRSFGKETHGN